MRIARPIFIVCVVLLAGCSSTRAPSAPQLPAPSANQSEHNGERDLVGHGRSDRSSSAEGVVHEPIVTLHGHYRLQDGRVNEHKFPVTVELHADGRLAGTFETWVEKRFTDGTGQLIFSTKTFRGDWTIKDNTFQIIVEKGTFLPDVAFREINGLKIIVMKGDS